VKVAAGFFPVRTVDEQADGTDQEIGHADHQVNALVIGTRLPHRLVFILRTGGSDGFLSGRARAGGARQSQEREQRQKQHKQRPAFHR
jgi:hypothetical protein